MKWKQKLLLSLFAVTASIVGANVQAVDEDVVFVRVDCSAIGNDQVCFNTMKELQDWLWNVRQPNADSRVSVNIGPGDFTQQPGTSTVFRCTAGNGFVSLIGSGPETTRLLGNGNSLVAEDCTDLHVQDITLETTGSYTIRWSGGGSSRWVNVDVKGNWNAWLDIDTDCNGANPIHYWFNSRLQHNGTASPGATYDTGCGESWFYGSEITYMVERSANSSVFSVHANADVRLFGSVIRAVVPDGADPGRNGAYIAGAKAYDNGNFHMHGGIISLNVSPLTRNVSVSGIENYGSGIMHTPETAFALKASGSGQIWRTYKEGSGLVQSPFTWPAATTPPQMATNGTLNGSDMFVETDCDSTGDCSGNSADPHPHLMIYDTACTGVGGPWYDVATNRCRE